MAYADFAIDSVEHALGLTIRPGDPSSGIEPPKIPAWAVELGSGTK